jgi:hypothetical protein
MREEAPGRTTTCFAARERQPVLCDFYTTIRDVEDLTQRTGNIAGDAFQRCSTSGASLGPVDNYLVRFGNLKQSRSLVAELSAHFLSALSSAAMGALNLRPGAVR